MTDTKARTAQVVVDELKAAGAEITPALEVAVKQKWTLPEGTMAELKAALAAVQMPTDLPSAEALYAANFHADKEACQAEAVRLVRNAKTNDWRQRTRLQAAIDARTAKFANVRAGKGNGGAKAKKALAGV